MLESRPPRTDDELLICVILFALAGCSGNRHAFKDPTPEQLFAAHAQVDWFGIGTNIEQLTNFCAWLRYRSISKPYPVREQLRHLYVQRNVATAHKGVCPLCATPRRYCQLPRLFVGRPQWVFGVGASPELNFCLCKHWEDEISSDNQVWEQPTHWIVLDRLMAMYSKGPWEGIEYQPGTDIYDLG